MGAGGPEPCLPLKESPEVNSGAMCPWALSAWEQGQCFCPPDAGLVGTGWARAQTDAPGNPRSENVTPASFFHPLWERQEN